MPKYHIEVLVCLEDVYGKNAKAAYNKTLDHFTKRFANSTVMIQRIDEVGKAEQAIKDAAKNNPRFIDKETEEAY